MLTTVATIILTAFTSACFTLILAWFIFEKRIKQAIERHTQKQIDQATEQIEQGVKRGVQEAITSISTTKVIRGTARNVAKSSRELVEGGFQSILKRRPDI